MSTDSDQQGIVVATYETHAQAEDAVKQLEKAGIDMQQLSIVGRDYHTEQNVVGYYNAGDRMKYWGKMGAFWGGLWGMLFGAGLFWVPGLGPLVVAGPLAAAIVGALENAIVIGGLSALGAGLFSLGIPKDSIVQYENAIQAGHYLLVLHGSAESVTAAKELIEKTDNYSVDHHQAAA